MKFMGEMILILIGVYTTLIGFRVISASKKEGPEYEEWFQKWGSKLKILGPLLIIIGIVMMILR